MTDLKTLSIAGLASLIQQTALALASLLCFASKESCAEKTAKWWQDC